MILRLCRLLIGVLVLSLTVPLTAHTRQAPKGKPKPPQLTLRANPTLGFAPLRVVATLELVGGADDYEDFYCPKLEWRWDDDTTSNTNLDCDPYVAGKSEIRRRYTTEHKYTEGPGSFEITTTLKQGSKTVGYAKVTVKIQ